MSVITLLCLTDGRGDCLQKTLMSFEEKVRGEITHRLMIDDSAEAAYAWGLDGAYRPDFEIIHHPSRRGFAGAIQSAWANMPPDTEYVFHLEDDFVFNQEIDLCDLVSILDMNPYLAQVALMRQPVGHEVAFGGFVKQFWDSYTDKEVGGLEFFEHQRFITTNPSLYRADLIKLGWPDAPHSEGMMGFKLWPLGYKCAFLGKKSDDPKVTHIGAERVGTGY